MHVKIYINAGFDLEKNNANMTDTRRRGEQNSTTGSPTAPTGAKSGAQQHNTPIPRSAHAPCTFAAILRREEEEEEAVPSCRQRELALTALSRNNGVPKKRALWVCCGWIWGRGWGEEGLGVVTRGWG